MVGGLRKITFIVSSLGLGPLSSWAVAFRFIVVWPTPDAESGGLICGAPVRPTETPHIPAPETLEWRSLDIQ